MIKYAVISHYIICSHRSLSGWKVPPWNCLIHCNTCESMVNNTGDMIFKIFKDLSVEDPSRSSGTQELY